MNEKWRKSTYSQGASNCVETGSADGTVVVRDTKEENLGDDRTVLEISPGAWIQFTDELKN